MHKRTRNSLLSALDPTPFLLRPMREPTPDEIDNDPEVQSILDEIEDEFFRINEEELEDSDDLFDVDEDDEDEDVVTRFNHRVRQGEWCDEEFN